MYKSLRFWYYFHSHQFEKASKLSNCNIYEVKKNQTLIRVQALSAFYMKNYYHARKCYELLLEHKVANADDQNKLAYIYSRHNEKENAIIAWCRANELHKNNPIATKALDYIKQKGREVNLIEDQFFEKLSCTPPLFIPFKKIFTISFIMFVIVSIGLAGFFLTPSIIAHIKKTNQTIEIVVIDDFNPNIISEPKEEKKEYSFTENEVRKNFDYIKDKIKKEDVNAAQIMLNTLRQSNISQAIRFKLDILEEFIEQPDYYHFKNTIHYQEIKQNPLIYQNIYVKWHGRIVNSVYDKKEKLIGFNLIIGNEEEGIVDAVIPVVFNKAVIAENNAFATVFGQLHMMKINSPLQAIS